VLPAGDDGPGAAALVRPEGADLFGYGAREAVLRALVGDPDDAAPFGSPSDATELAAALTRLGGVPHVEDDGLALGGDLPREAVRALAFAHGWVVDHGDRVRLRPRPQSP
jgi:coenzyme F420-0:L-glutamate ligase/coenzyme F420-1:gamma-L-glutamate ligase